MFSPCVYIITQEEEKVKFFMGWKIHFVDIKNQGRPSVADTVRQLRKPTGGIRYFCTDWISVSRC